MEDKIWYLKEINVLKGLSEGKRMKLGSYSSMTTFRKGEPIYLPGDFRNIYFLKRGSVGLITLRSDGSEIMKDVLEKGEIFGKCFGGENEEFNEEAVALEDSLVCYLSYEDWQEFLKENLDLNLSILKWAGLRLKRLERRMDTLYFKPTAGRVKDILADLAARFGRKDPVSGDMAIPIHLTHEELGQLTGCSRQNVTTILNEMRKQGFIDYTRNRLIIRKAIDEFNCW
jgi:CRP/FNR family cyclic AMP-dependent transcriptional regulator